MTDSEKDEEEKRSGAVLPLGGGAGAAGTPGWGGWLGALSRAMAVSPGAALLRILGGAVLGVAGLGLTATLYGRAQAGAGGPLAVSFDRRPGEAAADVRPPMENFVRGMAGLWGPVLGLSDAPADAGAPPAPPDAKVTSKDLDGKGSDGKGEAKDGDAEAAGRDAAAAGAAAGSGAPSAFVPGAALGGASGASAGGAGAAGAGAAAAVSAGGGAPEGAATGEASAKRAMQAAAARGGSRTAGAKAGKGALNQLKFAQNRSALGAASAAPERSYSTAQSAFEGGAPGAGGAIGGAGAGQGGAGVGSEPANPRRVDVGRALEDQKRLSCPSGYSLDGSDCKPLEGVNKTPYQGLVDMAKAFLIIGAALALLGLILITRPVPWMQALGGILLGAAAGLIIAALAIGADIQNRYGQKKQGDAIGSAAGRAGKGKSP